MLATYCLQGVMVLSGSPVPVLDLHSRSTGWLDFVPSQV